MVPPKAIFRKMSSSVSISIIAARCAMQVDDLLDQVGA
jgi:hypothetical protein